MAKKKASSKKSNVKKVVKKTVNKNKKITKTAKKAPAKKSAVKKVAKKTVTKNAAVKKAPAKTLKASSKKTSQKKSPKTSGKKIVKSAKTQSVSHLTKAVPATKKLDLTGFVTPLDDRLVVQPSGTEKMTPGGLYIPDTVADTSGNLEGVVVAVGRGHMNKKGHVRQMDVKVGDHVVFSQYAGSKIKIQNEDLVILRETDVMGVVAK